jgi:CTP:molybdopterin cytidylyltransferase MocA
VVYAAALFPELLAVTGDRGGRPVRQRHADRVDWLDLDDDGPAHDVDTPEDLAWIAEKLRKP